MKELKQVLQTVTTSWKRGIGADVGYLSARCARCSVGVLALLGATGGFTLLPFNGNGLQAENILLLGALESTGRGNACEVPV